MVQLEQHVDGKAQVTWKKLTENNCHELEWKLMKADPKQRSTWQSGVRSAMCAACHPPGRGPTNAPAH